MIIEWNKGNKRQSKRYYGGSDSLLWNLAVVAVALPTAEISRVFFSLVAKTKTFFSNTTKAKTFFSNMDS